MRVRVVAHAPTRGMRDLLFGDTSRVERPDLVEPWSVRVDHWVCGPEPACVETARLLGGEPLVVEDLAAPRAGDWSGISLHQVEVSDPVGLQAWLTDPYAAPPGGERWIDAISRVGTALDALADRRSRGPSSRTRWRVTPRSSSAATPCHCPPSRYREGPGRGVCVWGRNPERTRTRYCSRQPRSTRKPATSPITVTAGGLIPAIRVCSAMSAS
jgi:hypothetical protein